MDERERERILQCGKIPHLGRWQWRPPVGALLKQRCRRDPLAARPYFYILDPIIQIDRSFSRRSGHDVWFCELHAKERKKDAYDTLLWIV